MDSSALRHGTPWPHHLRWARLQSPLPGPDPDDALHDWRQAVGGDIAFDSRLSRDGLTVAHAHRAVRDHAPLPDRLPPWLHPFEDLRRACTVTDPAASSQRDLDDLDWLAHREESLPRAAGSLPFAHVWWPAVQEELARLRREHPSVTAQCAPSAMDDLALVLVARLTEVSSTVLLADMTAGLTLGERLLRGLAEPPTHPPRSEFARYCRQLADGGLDDVCAAYPVLPSLIGTVIRQWRAATLEMLTRIDRHRGDLCDLLGIKPDAGLTGIGAGAGDRHNDGRSVAVLAFGDARVVYKPRDVRLEHLWSRLAAAVSGDRDEDTLLAPRVLPADDGTPYGFTEFIPHVPARSPEEQRAFYRDAGRTLALLHALCATDCHHENLMAHGSHLVLLDAESLFETRNPATDVDEPGGGAGRATVLQVGMLPSWLWMEGEQLAVDISALGSTPERTTRRAAHGWRAVNTDAMSRGAIDAPTPHPTSLPTAPGVAPRLPEHVDDLVEGFSAGYRALLSARHDALPRLLDEAAVLRRRLIVRPTYVYVVLLQASLRPDALRSLTARGMVLERLSRAHLDEPTWPLLEAEQEALARLDVPLFESNLTGDHTYWPGGSMAGWPGTDALADVRRRIGLLDEADLAWQVRLIRSAVAAAEFAPSTAEAEPAPVGTVPVADRSTMAERVRDRIVADAEWTDGHASWMTLAMLPTGDHVNVQRIGSGLYDGVLGIALHLAHADRRDLADAALAPLLDELDSADTVRLRRHLLLLGLGWSGAGGHLRALRALEHAGLLDAARTRRCVGSVVEALPVVDGDRRLDVMNGVAGLITPLAAELRRDGWSAAERSRMTSWIASAADLLVGRQRDDGGWMTLPASAPLTGLAHGASGIAVALAEAADVIPEPRYLDAALRALAYEASTFDGRAGNWPDYRDSAGGGFMLGWCAGAPGIALARMRLLQLLPDHPGAPAWRAELEVAAATTATAALLPRDHVCCGNLGRAAVLRTLAGGTGRQDWADDADRLVDAVVSRSGGGLPRSILGTPAQDVLAVPGLMTGLAGCGLALAGGVGSAALGDLLL